MHGMTIPWENSVAVFEADPNVIAAWLFGSAHKGTMRPDSDIDIGVLFAQKPTLDELLDLSISVQNALGFDDVDLVVLNGASSVLRFEALCGRSLFCRDLEARAGFASLTARQYEESMALYARGLAARKAALARAQA